MNLNDYQEEAQKTDRVPARENRTAGDELMVPLLGLAGEAGELLSEYKKHIRDGKAHILFPARVEEELGDILWYVANLATKFKITLEQIAETIAGRGLDVLIYPELGMDGRTLTLASMKLARVQLCAWGHPVTTGLPTIDSYFSCAEMEPENSALHYSEPQILLPGLGTRYLKPKLPTVRTATELGLPLGGRVLVAQSPFKLLPDNDLRMVALAHAAPTAQFILFDTFYSGVNDAIKLRLETTFDAHDLNPERLHWQPMTERAHFLQIVRACDVALDSHTFSGGNTSLDALIMGLPLVTSPGEFMRGRQSSAMLTALGLEHCVVAADEVANTAANFLLHRDARKAYQGVLAQALDDYLVNDAPLKALVAAISEVCG